MVDLAGTAECSTDIRAALGYFTPLSGTVTAQTDVTVTTLDRDASNNDKFQDAIHIWDGSPIRRNNFNYTTEPREPVGKRTAWFSWTSPFSDILHLATTGTEFPISLAVWVGTSPFGLNDKPETNNLLALSDGTPENPAVLDAFVLEGKTYYFQVGGVNGAQGFYSLQYTPGAEPAKFQGAAKTRTSVTGNLTVASPPVPFMGTVHSTTQLTGQLTVHLSSYATFAATVHGSTRLTVTGLALLQSLIIPITSLVGSRVKPVPTTTVATGERSTTDRTSTLSHYYI